MAGNIGGMVVDWGPAHRDGAIEVIRAVYEEYDFPWDPEVYHADLYDVDLHYLQQGGRFWVYLHEGQVAGTVALERYPLIEGQERLIEVEGKARITGTDCSLERLYVHPGFRRLGIGKRLCEAVIVAAKDAGCVAMEIWSDKVFGAAHGLYQSVGAELVGDRTCHDLGTYHEWGFRLPLR